jgi:antitoxin component YwqK of YwqJK toxin-antitoxin module
VQELYNPNGSIKSLTPIKDGKIEGVLKQFDDEGKLLTEESYHNNLKNGWQINYNPPTGKIKFKAMFRNDTMQGPMIQYYLEGQLWRESNYINGHLEGIVKTYWPNGKIKMETPFEHGKKIPGEKKYDEQGNLLKE